SPPTGISSLSLHTLFRSVRGGSWEDEDPARLRSAVRRGSEKSWKMQDPQLPKSIWYHTDARFLGFRVVRPLKVPPPEELSKYWRSEEHTSELQSRFDLVC